MFAFIDTKYFITMNFIYMQHLKTSVSKTKHLHLLKEVIIKLLKFICPKLYFIFPI